MKPSRSTPTPAAQASGLSRSLSVWEAIGVSIALMAPSMAININPQGTASVAGRAVPLAFFLAFVAVLFIAYTFVRLSQRFNHAGSVYGFVGATLGPRSGIVAGWLNVGTYLFFGVVTSMAAGRFVHELTAFIWVDEPDFMAYVYSWIVLAAVWFVSTRQAKGGTRVLLIVEGVTVALILIVAAIVLVRLLTGSAPNGNHVDLSVFSVAQGVDPSNVFLGIVFGFLSFAGFEAAATLGEEARNPRRDIPRAILGTAVFGGLFFTVITAIEVMAYGSDDAGMEKFLASGSLIGDLASGWVAPWLGIVITVGAAISAAACALACVVGASRLIFAMSRDGLGFPALAKIHTQHRVPHVAAGASVLIVIVLEAVALIVFQTPSLDLFVNSGTAGTLILLVAYGLATVGAIKLLFFSGSAQVRRWEIAIPIIALLFLGYTIFRNLIPLPEGGALWGAGLAAATVVIVLAVVLARPAAAARAGRLLTQSEGLETAKPPVRTD